MLDLNSVVTPSPGIVPRKTGDEYVLVPVKGNKGDRGSICETAKNDLLDFVTEMEKFLIITG